MPAIPPEPMHASWKEHCEVLRIETASPEVVFVLAHKIVVIFDVGPT
jgi:hypothetical protein